MDDPKRLPGAVTGRSYQIQAQGPNPSDSDSLVRRGPGIGVVKAPAGSNVQPGLRIQAHGLEV